MSRWFTEQVLQCYFMQEKNEDASDVFQGAFDIIDEFVDAFGTNANKNLNVQSKKVDLLMFLAKQSSDALIVNDIYDLALNTHSRFFGDNDATYANIMSVKVITNLEWVQTERESQEAIEMLLQCLTIYYEDEENNKQRIQEVHFYLSSVYASISTIEEMLMHGRIAIKLEKEIYGEIRSSGLQGDANFNFLFGLGGQLRFISTESKRFSQELYDAATEYLHEALAIANANQSRDVQFDTPMVYIHLSYLELQKEGGGNLQKALEYKEKGLLIFSEIDQTAIRYEDGLMKIIVKEFDILSNLIKRKFHV